ncbi:hypothetical protein [Streptomyces sp. NBC_01235]|uniref:hypothetical protein n=1 Tax=Streptomyces sp. NBC_01235 TaxID=2903788 RepID=UPI002E0EBB55|nr:hypothetical protein OG289_14095 [Streptomyces sp. NBC_01235]
MAAIVVVHGIGNQYLGARTLHSGIAPALLDGVRAAHPEGPSLGPEDIEVAFYGNLFRPAGTTAVKGGPEPDPREPMDPYDVELLLAWWAEAARIEPDRVPPLTTDLTSKAPTPRLAQQALHALARSRFLARSGDRFLLGVLRQVRRYLTEPDVRARVQATVAAAVGPDTRVLVGHSLGSVVAYEALAAHPEWPVRALVTLGSPLGIPHLVLDRLDPPPKDGRGRWPGTIERWTNLCDRRDVVALVKTLGPVFDDAHRHVHDVLVDNGWQAHAIAHHLTAAETGAAITAGLPPQDRPQDLPEGGR